MSLTKQDKEEIKALIHELLSETKTVGEDVPTFEWKRFFDNWRKKSLSLTNNITLASEDFVLPIDFELKDGTVMKKGKRYFTYDEAMALEKELFKPNGWRLPETKEFMTLHAYYGLDDNSQDNVAALYSTLRLEATGWIDYRGMKKYNLTLNEDGTVIDRTTDGYWWSRNASTATYANFLSTYFSSNTGYVNAQRSRNRGVGFSIRCVKEEGR